MNWTLIFIAALAGLLLIEVGRRVGWRDCEETQTQPMLQEAIIALQRTAARIHELEDENRYLRADTRPTCTLYDQDADI